MLIQVQNLENFCLRQAVVIQLWLCLPQKILDTILNGKFQNFVLRRAVVIKLWNLIGAYIVDHARNRGDFYICYRGDFTFWKVSVQNENDEHFMYLLRYFYFKIIGSSVVYSIIFYNLFIVIIYTRFPFWLLIHGNFKN